VIEPTLNARDVCSQGFFGRFHQPDFYSEQGCTSPYCIGVHTRGFSVKGTAVVQRSTYLAVRPAHQGRNVGLSGSGVRSACGSTGPCLNADFPCLARIRLALSTNCAASRRKRPLTRNSLSF